MSELSEELIQLTPRAIVKKCDDGKFIAQVATSYSAPYTRKHDAYRWLKRHGVKVEIPKAKTSTERSREARARMEKFEVRGCYAYTEEQKQEILDHAKKVCKKP